MLPNEVGRVLREDPLAPVSVDAALLDVRWRAKRDRARNAGIAGLAAAAVVATVVAVPLLKGTPKAGPVEDPGVDTTGAVPWSDRGDYQQWEPPAPEPRQPTTPCTAADLKVWKIEQDGAMQRALSFVFLEKRTDGRCTLDGHAVLTGLRNGGRVVVPTADSGGPWFGGMETPATVESGEVARTTYMSVAMCEANQTGSGENPVADYQDIALRLPDGSSIPLGRDLRSNCLPQTTPYYRDNAPIEQPVRWPAIRTAVELPGSVQPGEVLEYVVTLTNAGGEAIDLAPCGGFRQELAFQDMNTNELAKPVIDTHRINCDTSPVLAPGESRRYVMRLPVPPGAMQLAEARLSWQLVDTSPDHGAQGFVTVGNGRASVPVTGDDPIGKLCTSLDFQGRTYVLAENPGVGVGEVVGKALGSGCGVEGSPGITVYSANEQAPEDAVTATFGDEVGLYTPAP